MMKLNDIELVECDEDNSFTMELIKIGNCNKKFCNYVKTRFAYVRDIV